MSFDAERWLRSVGETPRDVAQALEVLAWEDFDRIADELLEAVDEGFRQRRGVPRRGWRLPVYGGTTRLLGPPWAAHVAVAVSLAARGNGLEAERVRQTESITMLPASPCWVHDGFERFPRLARFKSTSAWHPDAAFPRRFFCMPAARTVIMTGAQLGDAVLAAAEWELPVIEGLSLSGNGLTRVPEGTRGLGTWREFWVVGKRVADGSGRA